MINSRIFQLAVFSACMINFRIIGNQACHISYFYSEQNVKLSRVTTDQIGKDKVLCQIEKVILLFLLE